MITRMIYEEVRAFFAAVWRAVVDLVRGPGANGMTLRPVFAGVWQNSGNTYSVILAQAGSLSQRYRRLFLSEVAKLVDSTRGAELAAMERQGAPEPKEVRVPKDRSTHLFVQAPDFLVLGFEDNEAIELQRKHSLRYDEYLRARHPQPLFAFVSPGVYEPTSDNAQKLRRFVPVDDGRLIGWADECLIDWLGSAELRLGQASDIVGRCFAGSPSASVRLDLSAGTVEPGSSSNISQAKDAAGSLASRP
jgi:hypothetical protein